MYSIDFEDSSNFNYFRSFDNFKDFGHFIMLRYFFNFNGFIGFTITTSCFRLLLS